MLKFLFRKKNNLSDEEMLIDWEKKGKPSPPPHIVKQLTIEKFQKKFRINILVETGTFLGDMVESQKEHFKKIISIELSENLFRKAEKKFRDYSHIEIIQGDSGTILPSIISKLNEPALFWLDGHYSGGITAQGSKECPIPEELNAIFKSDLPHVILIDDARLFNGTHDYPTIDEINALIVRYNKKFLLVIDDDIIRLTPEL